MLYTYSLSSHPQVNHLGYRPVFLLYFEEKYEPQSQLTCLKLYNKKVRSPDTHPGARPYPATHGFMICLLEILLLPAHL